MTNKCRILLINGPNLNLLGIREPHIYGYETLSDVVANLYKTAESLGIQMDHFQSNAEHELIECIHKNYKNTDFIIINPAAFTHTSIALRDAFLSVNIDFIEIHLSNIYIREKFRYRSYLSDIALGVVCGFGVYGYHCALHMAHKYLSKN
ncbi:type II 3-dehydroquinate dehydratase [Blochmannia endosymbiont of Camponotus sp. C-046]|uniref:type II 3-dehydroquinate dehydratase n=1 Tax=Blochmannia endosymbiont of Camponotus sp. C-046 TaxID=2945589 RepID=UPI0020252B5F|nr:type II 3-dehydroquinate dehydratase [Blochmannia endosymbiont of Camponotus sp. C-046]URJ28988.1 type II 3-dehydroquinate dehydratase [Blochmannia endosymbiont of Camponotus sp. C-046]